jgi:hypothetical protein
MELDEPTFDDENPLEPNGKLKFLFYQFSIY